MRYVILLLFYKRVLLKEEGCLKAHLPVFRVSKYLYTERPYLKFPPKAAGKGAEPKFPATSQAESKLPKHRNPCGQGKYESHTGRPGTRKGGSMF